VSLIVIYSFHALCIWSYLCYVVLLRN